LTAQNARSVVLSNDPTSVSSYFREASYGQTWLTGDVYGPYVIPVNTGCPTGSISSYGDQAALAQAGAAKMATYTRYVYLFQGRGCGWWGYGTVGGNPSRTWVTGSFNASAVIHEMGHGLHAYLARNDDLGSGERRNQAVSPWSMGIAST
jgi:hypothetical protein